MLTRFTVDSCRARRTDTLISIGIYITAGSIVLAWVTGTSISCGRFGEEKQGTCVISNKLCIHRLSTDLFHN